MFRLVSDRYLRALEERATRESAAAFAAREIARSEREMRESGDALLRAVMCSALGEPTRTVVEATCLSPATRARVDQLKAHYRAQRDEERHAGDADATADTSDA